MSVQRKTVPRFGTVGILVKNSFLLFFMARIYIVKKGGGSYEKLYNVKCMALYLKMLLILVTRIYVLQFGKIQLFF